MWILVFSHVKNNISLMPEFFVYIFNFHLSVASYYNNM